MKKISIAALLASALSVPHIAMAQPDFPHLSTTGYGEVVATPDMAVISVQVEETMLNAEQAKQAVDKAIGLFVDRLLKEGISRDSISSTNLYLSPQYHYPKAGQAELVGYQASRSVTLTIDDLENLNAYLEGALGDGINRINDIALKVKDESKYQEQARMAAIKDANTKANSLAKGFEQTLDGIWKISYNNSSSRPVLMKSMAMDARGESNSYQDSQIVIRDRVDVTYKLK